MIAANAERKKPAPNGRWYDDFMEHAQTDFEHALTIGPLVTTDAGDLWNMYLQSFPVEEQQHYNCHECRRFIERYGNLAVVREDGTHAAALWDDMSPPFAVLRNVVEAARITGVFISADRTWGNPVTGEWHHLGFRFPDAFRYAGTALLTAGQAMAAKLENFRTVERALEEFTPAALATALKLLETDSIGRAEKVLGPVRWLADLQKRRAQHMGKRMKDRRDGVLWHAIATAPEGFCHPRASMAGALLEDIALGYTFADVKARWEAKMHPTQYQRPQAPPAAGTIAQAEKVIETLGLTPSLERRIARLDDVARYAVWAPKAEPQRARGGVFGHLQAKGDTPATGLVVDMPPVTMTWEKFRTTVLPRATALQFLVTGRLTSFAAMVTAVNPDAPPILQWDRAEQRNPVNSYVWMSGSHPTQWGLERGWVDVDAVIPGPKEWLGGVFEHHAKQVFFILAGARETRNAGVALFPEVLRSELHGVRAVIEAFSKSATMQGLKDGSACGLVLSAHREAVWNESTFRVTVDGSVVIYKLDRWD